MKYDDILYKERPHAKFPMSLNDRAKIFLPFAALKGYEELIDQKNQREIHKIELSQDALEELDEKLQFLQDNLPIPISISYYEDCHYHTVKGNCLKIDRERNEMKIDTKIVSLQSIYEINI